MLTKPQSCYLVIGNPFARSFEISGEGLGRGRRGMEPRVEKGPAQGLLLAFPRPLDCPSLPLSPLALPRVDSIMLVEEGFSVTSVDASDKMLKYALKERWNRRHEPAFDKWGTHVQAGLPRPAPQGPVLSALGSFNSCANSGVCFPEGDSIITFISPEREA